MSMQNLFSYNCAIVVQPENAHILSYHQMLKDPWKTRPVVSTCGIDLHALSKWVDYHH